MADDDDKLRLNPGYLLGQFVKALSGAGEHAAERAKQWQKALTGLLNGTLHFGSRTPVDRVPPWVTLQVLHGGFASGDLAAGGPLQPHELEKLAALPSTPDASTRTALNLHFVGDVGRSELATMAREGRFRIGVPEEGALLVACWLLQHGESERAAALLEAISPFFDRLRFYPLPHALPRRTGAGVSLQTAGESVQRLRAKRPQKSVERMNESLRIWAPLYDRAVALFLETVEGETPVLLRSDAGELVRGENGQPLVTGGWPCRRFPEDWRARAEALLNDYRRERAQHQLCGKPERRKENFARLRGHLETCVRDSGSLTRGEVGMIRRILASFVTRHGAPGSTRLQTTRATQARIAARPTHRAIAGVLANQLAQFPPDEGIPDPESIIYSLSSEVASKLGVRSIEPLPEALRARALRCLEAPVPVLIEKGLLPSSETLAKVLPAWTANVRAAAIPDPELRRIYAAVDVAFRRRRSLLLLNLESQVKLHELPWIAAVEPWVGADEASRTAAHSTLVEVATLALRTFPHTLLPNKLVKELRALRTSAGLTLPLVDELAADIFMGAFSENFLSAGKAAARLLSGTLYERYFGLDYERVLKLDDVQKGRFGTPFSVGFADLCAALAGSSAKDQWSVARNGTIIEQAQILTTHNLAALVAELDLARALDLPDLARRTFKWICRRQRLQSSDWRAQLQTMKNTAYAWRQMIFYLSLVESAEVHAFLDWSAAHLKEQRGEFQARFAPVLSGLKAIVAGEHFDADGVHHGSGGRRLLGWSVGRHWLLPRDRAQGNARG
jgi:hypothetical protein